MNNLEAKIAELSREEALEAARYLSQSLGATTDKAETEKKALQSLTAQPYANVADIEQLARLLLLSAAATPEYEGAVQKAIKGAGEKQFILGGAEIVALASLALYALHLVITKGKTLDEQVVRITEEKGESRIEIRKTVRYGISARVSDILKGYFGMQK
jgi:hypothetical protein